MKEIQLTNSQLVVLVDDEDYELLAEEKWRLTDGPGRSRSATMWINSPTKNFIIYMHRVIMNAPSGMDVDHRNRNSLDNRKENLRICTRSQNLCNRPGKPGSSSKFKGVTWVAVRGDWMAQIQVNRKNKYLGFFQKEEEAAVAYNRAALKLHGEFAYLNPV